MQLRSPNYTSAGRGIPLYLLPELLDVRCILFVSGLVTALCNNLCLATTFGGHEVHTQTVTGLFTRNRTPTRSLIVSQELYVKDLFGRHVSLIDGLTRRFDSPADPTVSLSPEQSPETGSSEWERMQRHCADYMALVGAYLWLANVSRPELSYITHLSLLA